MIRRLWSIQDIHVLTRQEDLGFLKTLPSSDWKIEFIDNPRKTLSHFQATDTWPGLMVWDLADFSAELEEFVQTTPDFNSKTSILVVATDAAMDSLGRWANLGISDFLCRPLNPKEAILRMDQARKPWVRGMRITFDFLRSIPVDLTITEQRLLYTFLSSPNMGAQRQEIMSQVWSGMTVHSNTLDVHLFNLRKKLASSGLKITFHSRSGRWNLLQNENFKHSHPQVQKIANEVLL